MEDVQIAKEEVLLKLWRGIKHDFVRLTKNNIFPPNHSGNMHPSKHIKGSKGDDLKGKHIVLGVTGSIGAVECIKLIRELIREGAEVSCIMTEWAQKIVHPYSLEFASGKSVITELTGQVEHVDLCGEVPDKADLYLIAPATANTISKIACGIDDTPVTTFATTSIGSGIPVVIVPAMHKSMYQHPIVIQNMNKLKEIGIEFIGPNMDEGTAKVAGRAQIVDQVIRKLDHSLNGKKITIITGRTQEPIDSMRVLSNRATGKSGIIMAERAYRKGADVELWYANVQAKVPDWIPSKEFDSLNDLIEMKDEVSDIVIVPAALSDFGTKEVSKDKISSDEELIMELKPLPKFIDLIKEKTDLLVAYKATDTKEMAEKEGKLMLENGRADIVVANSLSDVKEDENIVYLPSIDSWIEGDKRYIADKILELVEKHT